MRRRRGVRMLSQPKKKERGGGGKIGKLRVFRSLRPLGGNESEEAETFNLKIRESVKCTLNRVAYTDQKKMGKSEERVGDTPPSEETQRETGSNSSAMKK